MSDFYLDTGNMNQIIGEVKQIADRLEAVKRQYRDSVNKLTEDWQGEGKKEFSISAWRLLQNMGDISQTFYDIAEEITDAAEEYKEIDTYLAKQQDGVTNNI